jgi:hypothetical protein
MNIMTCKLGTAYTANEVVVIPFRNFATGAEDSAKS